MIDLKTIHNVVNPKREQQMKETIKEFIARGGKITKIPAQEHTITSQPISLTAAGPAVILTYSDADLYYGEGRPRKTKKEKTSSRVDFSALPEALRKKYIKELLDDED